MYEFHGWFGLAEMTGEPDTTEAYEGLIRELQGILAGLLWRNAEASLRFFNGWHFLTVTGLRNRPVQEARDLDMILAWLAEKLPGSYGLLHERSDELPGPPGPGAFRVRVLARGQVVMRLDPFLSPTIPTIED